MNFSDQSRIWIYLSNRAFNLSEVAAINNRLQQFCIDWTAHGSNLHAKGEVIKNHFILLMVDESKAGASGCSIDKSVHFMQSLEKEFGVELFNRLLFAWMNDGRIVVSQLGDLQKLADDGVLQSDTMVFDTLLTVKKEFDERFEIPLHKSWMMKKLKRTEPAL